jgi:aldehyde dehydrogenase (NAD+)
LQTIYVCSETLNPTNGKGIGAVAEAKAKDVDIAVKAAAAAFEKLWGLNVPGSARGKMLMDLADKIEAHTDTFAVRTYIHISLFGTSSKHLVR